ncbi:MAG TPA: cytidylate kinase-like family protein [Gemmatimonadaceae bacterium]
MPVITISRMYGCGGGEVAQRVAQALDWPLYDNAFVDAVAEQLGLPAAEVAEREERVQPLVERLAEALSLATPEILPSPAGGTPPRHEEHIAAVTTRIIQEVVARGNAVIVGRGAQSVLAERTDVIHVLCYAPHPALVARTMMRLDVSAREAERIVNETNAEREHYVKQHFKRAWLSFDNYHVCLNTEWLGLDGAAEIVVRLAREKFGL